MEKTLNNIRSLVNGPSEEMRTVSLSGKCEPIEARLVMNINPYIGIMAGIVQRVELTATSVSENSPPLHIIFIYMPQQITALYGAYLVFSRTATVVLNSTYTRANTQPTMI